MSNIKDPPYTINYAKCFLKSEKNIWNKGVNFEMMYVAQFKRYIYTVI